MKDGMQIYSLASGALLLDTESEALLIGGGLPVETLKQQLLPYRRKLSGLLVPNEHSHRFRGIYELSVQWELPLIGHWTIILRELMKNTPAIPPQVYVDFKQNLRQCGEFSICSFPVKYDSQYPCGWNITYNGRSIGIVQDGRLTEQSLEVLKQCDALVLQNCRSDIPNGSPMLVRRQRSVYPTAEEQKAQLTDAGIDLPELPVMALPDPSEDFPLYPAAVSK